MSDDPFAGVSVTFYNHPVIDIAASRAKGVPIAQDVPHIEVRRRADPKMVLVAPAHEKFHLTEGGYRQSYAEVFAEQWAAFERQEAQPIRGTPIDELPGISKSVAMRLKAQEIYTVQSLAELEDRNLRKLGPMANDLRDKARAYLERGQGAASVAEYEERIQALEAKLAEQLQQGQRERERAPAKQRSRSADQEKISPFLAEFEGWNDDAMKAFIADHKGERPRGQIATQTLRERCAEIAADLAARRGDRDAA